MGNNRITGLADGTADTDAVTVSQMRAEIAALKAEIVAMNLFIVQSEGGST